MRLIIVRHGQTNPKEYLGGNWDLPKADAPITELGDQQAMLLGEEIRRIGFTGKIYSSPFLRTIRTAHFISQATGLKIDLEPRFREMVFSTESMKDFRGMTLEELKAQYPEIIAEHLPMPWWSQEPEGENEVKARVLPVIEELLAKNEDCLLVGHGASTNAANKILLEKSSWKINEEIYRIPSGYNCTLSEYRIENGDILPIKLYSHAHLPLSMVTSNYRMSLEKKEEA